MNSAKIEVDEFLAVRRNVPFDAVNVPLGLLVQVFGEVVAQRELDVIGDFADRVGLVELELVDFVQNNVLKKESIVDRSGPHVEARARVLQAERFFQ
ncbi:UNVERIFIED_CONTAM: hypothetical protein ACS92_04450 [Bacillus cereus]